MNILYWNIDTSGRTQSAAGTGLSNAAFQQQASFTGFNFDEIWDIDEGNSFPYLQNNEQDPLPGPPDGFEPPVFAGGDGSAGDPYQIANEDHLNAVRDFQSFSFVLIDDIDLGGNDPSGPFWNDGEGWVPLGSTTSAFTGNFDGNGFEISGLYINRTGSAGQFGSLFGVMLGASVTDLVITDGSVTGGQNVGLLAGQVTDGTISGITLSGEVNGSGQMGALAAIVQGASQVSDIDSSADVGLTGSVQNAVGGILYRLSNTSSLTSARFTGSIRGGVNTAGIVAETGNASQILQVLSAGEISGGQNTGGIVGNHAGSAVIRDAISVSRISATGSNPAGGIAGAAGGSTEISESYFAGFVEAETTAAIAGNAGGTITNTFWSTQINAAEGTGGGTGLTSAAMKLEASFTGFDFSSSGPWSIREGITLPYLNAFDDHFTGGPQIDGHTLNGGEGWRLLASSVADAAFGDFLNGLWTQGFTGAETENGQANVYSYSRASNAFLPLGDAGNTIEAGDGFAIYVFADDNFDGTPDPFPKGPLAQGFEITGDLSIPLTEFDAVENNPAGYWTLAGNSYLWPVSSDDFITTGTGGVVYAYDSSIPGYISWNGATGDLTDGILQPFQGFFIESVATGASLIIPESAQIDGSGPLVSGRGDELLSIRLFAETEEGRTGSLWLSFTDDAFPNARQLMPLDTSDFLELATEENGLLFDSYNLKLNPGEEHIIPLSLSFFKFAEQGWEPGAAEVELSWQGVETFPEDWQLSLYDSETGSHHSLEAGGSITVSLVGDGLKFLAQPADRMAVTARKGAGESRFSVHITQGSGTSAPVPELPEQVELAQNYPNPFNPETVIEFALSGQSEVRLQVFNIQGQLVATLADGARQAGVHRVRFDATALASGVYLYRLQVRENGQSGSAPLMLTRKMTVIR